MKRLAAFSAIALMLVGCGKSKDSNLTTVEPSGDSSRDSLRQALANQDSLLVLITEISEGMENLKRMENILSVETPGELPDKRQQIRNDMSMIQQAIINNRNRLAQLEERLNKANNNNAHLRRAIVSLKGQIAQQVTTIETLRSELTAANIQIDRLNLDRDSLMSEVAATTEERNEVIQQNIDLTNEMNICYYALGSKDELKAHKIIETGFLRKTKVLPEDFEHNYFTVSDKRILTSIPLGSNKAQVMSNHPSDSYRLDTAENGLKTLVIINPERFWSTSNYLVVKTD